MPSLVTPPPSDRTIYIVHFLQKIEESFLLKTFSHAGKIKKTIIGSYQPKRTQRRAHKKRILYYALVVFKTAESVEKLRESKYLQKKVNALAKRTMGFEANPFLKGEEHTIPQNDSDDSDLDDEERAERKKFEEYKRSVEAKGFTLVTNDHVNPHRRRGKDTYGTVVEGITEEEMQRIVEKQKLKQELQKAGDQQYGGGAGQYTTNKEKRNQIKADFYMFQKRLAMKNELEALREGFEKDRKRLAKALSKKANRQEKAAAKQ